MKHDWWLQLDLGALLIGLVGFVWWARSVVCPICGARPSWMAMNGKASGLATMEACPSCGYKPPPTAEEIGGT
jgi:hypothetical protein